MEKHQYECNYCKKEYIPKRRRVQKFCSDSCRVSSHQLKNKNSKKELIKSDNYLPKKTTVDQMSLAGVGNSAAGTLVVGVLKNVFTKDENKPATRKDLKELTSKLERYQEIKNLRNDTFGKRPYYDTIQRIIVYR